MRVLVVALTVVALGCVAEPRPRSSAATPSADPRLIYAAALGDTGGAPPGPRGAATALRVQLMSDDGGGGDGASVRLPDSVASYLVARGLVAEVCVLRDAIRGAPRCVAQHAPLELQLSRVLRVSRDTVRVYVGTSTIQPAAEPPPPPGIRIPFAEVVRVTLGWRDGRWRVVDRRATMIT